MSTNPIKLGTPPSATHMADAAERIWTELEQMSAADALSVAAAVAAKTLQVHGESRARQYAVFMQVVSRLMDVV